jgi:hypothetical protein
VAPVYVLAPERMRVPLPILLRSPGPVMAPVRVAVKGPVSMAAVSYEKEDPAAIESDAAVAADDAREGEMYGALVADRVGAVRAQDDGTPHVDHEAGCIAVGQRASF